MNLENITSYLGERGISVEQFRKPGLYGIGGPGLGGRIAVVRHENRLARLDMFVDGQIAIHPMEVSSKEFASNRSFWQSLLSDLPTVIKGENS